MPASSEIEHWSMHTSSELTITSTKDEHDGFLFVVVLRSTYTHSVCLRISFGFPFFCSCTDSHGKGTYIEFAFLHRHAEAITHFMILSVRSCEQLWLSWIQNFIFVIGIKRILKFTTGATGSVTNDLVETSLNALFMSTRSDDGASTRVVVMEFHRSIAAQIVSSTMQVIYVSSSLENNSDVKET